MELELILPQPGTPAILGFMRRNGGDRRNETKRDEPRDRLGPREERDVPGWSPTFRDCWFSGPFFSAGLAGRLGWGLCNVRARDLRLRRPPRLAGNKGTVPVGARGFGFCCFFRLGWNGRLERVVGIDGACVT